MNGNTSVTAAPAAASSPNPRAMTGEASGGAASAAAAPPTAPAAQFAACFSTGGPYSDCETLYVTMTQSAPARCVQLTFDKCENSAGKRGLGASVPSTWRLSSGSVGASSSPCELGVFYPNYTLVDDASGSAQWEAGARQPSAIELALSLELPDAPNVEVTTAAPLEPSTCED